MVANQKNYTNVRDFGHIDAAEAEIAWLLLPSMVEDAEFYNSHNAIPQTLSAVLVFQTPHPQFIYRLSVTNLYSPSLIQDNFDDIKLIQSNRRHHTTGFKGSEVLMMSKQNFMGKRV